PEVEEIPVGVRRLAAWSWRLIVIVAASALLLWGLLQVTVIVIPVLIAVLLTVLLTPIVDVLTKYTFLGRSAASFIALVGVLQVTVMLTRVLIAFLLTVLLTPIVNVLTKYTFLGRGAASFIALVGLLLVIAGMFTLAGRQLIAQWPDIQTRAVEGFQSLLDWTQTTFQIDMPMINTAIDEGLDQLQQYSGQLVSGAMSTAAVLSNLATGIVVCLFSLFFLLSSGGAIWRWLV